MTYRRVVVGTDGSPTATLAVEQAAGLAAAFGSELLIVTAYQSRAREAPQGAPEDILWRITDSGVANDHARHAAHVAVTRGVPAGQVHAIAEPGDAADALVGIAEARGGDLIVVGSKGMTSATRVLGGNVPNRVSHHAPCDVMIVHTAP